MRREVEAIGTNAHELPMVYAALARNDDELVDAPYRVMRQWQREHDGNLRIILSDTFGSPEFLSKAPDWLAGWTGIRIDSGLPVEIAELALDWWRAHGEDPASKRIIFSDGLDVDSIEDLHRGSPARPGPVSAGEPCLPTTSAICFPRGLAPFSLVCKAVSADGRPTVKLSDNPLKSMGPKDEVERYRRAFGVGEQAPVELLV